MAIHITLFVLFFFACDAKGIDDIESLKREHEIFKEMIHQLKTTNENLNSKLTALETDQTSLKEDVKRLGAKVIHLESVNKNLEQDQANVKAKVYNLENENNILKSLFDLRSVVGHTRHNVSAGNTTTTTKRMVEKQVQEPHDGISTEKSRYS